MGIFMPDITTHALMYLIATWALFTGISEIVVAIQFRRVLTDEWMLIIGGLLSIGFGALLVAFPAAGAVSMTWLIGFYAIVLGSSEMIFAFHLRGLRREFVRAMESGI
jgi:uncharacterized membrane protein HdeD (DUF308 family)